MSNNHHSFYIPVMGTGYTIDTPIKVAHLGISSVISLVDDGLIEKIRVYHSRLNNLTYEPITPKQPDYRAVRITTYLNMVNEISQQRFDQMINEKLEKGTALSNYIDLLPEESELKKMACIYKRSSPGVKLEFERRIKQSIRRGSIDVNIMSKGDAERYNAKKEQLPIEFNDAHSAVRGYLKSNLENSAFIISAGMNTRLFSYLATFNEILPERDGSFKKRLIIKVSDFRSAAVQARFLAQRGVWVSEFRVESGLNCGGHAFPTKGFLIGPILEEFKQKRKELDLELRKIYIEALAIKGIFLTSEPAPILVSAQGGVGTSLESAFLRRQYGLSGVGWGSPFLLVPEVVNIDRDTIRLVANAKETDVYLSNTSPFGIPFYSLKGNSKDIEKNERIHENMPGSSCPKRFVALNTEFGSPPLCTASRQYQKLKIKQITDTESDPLQRKKKIDSITEKSCICVGLGTAALLVNGLDRRVEGESVSVCPGPNIAYFNRAVSLQEMVDHIYGRKNLIKTKDRPHFLLKELELYYDYVSRMKDDYMESGDEKTRGRIIEIIINLLQGIEYYRHQLSAALITNGTGFSLDALNQIMRSLRSMQEKLKIPQLLN